MAIERAKTLVCVELPSQLSAIMGSESFPQGCTSYKFIALTPHVEYALRRSGVSYKRPEDYYEEDEMHQLGSDELRRLDEICAFIDQHVRKHLSVYRDYDLSPARLNWYSLKLLLNSAAAHLFMAYRILAREKPDQVVCLASAEEPISRNLFFVNESIWSLVLPLICRHRRIPCERLSPVTKEAGTPDISEWNAKEVIRRVVGESYYDGLSRIYRRLRELSLASVLLRRDGAVNNPRLPCVVLLSLGYGLRPLAEEIRKHGEMRILYWDVANGDPPVFLGGASSLVVPESGGQSDAQAKAHAEKMWDSLSHEQFAKLFELNGVNFFQLIESRLRHFFLAVLPDMLRIDRIATSLFKRFAPVAVVGGAMGDYRSQVVAHVARRLGSPVVVYKHGSSGAYVWMESGRQAYEYTLVTYRNDIRPADFYLGNGEGDQRYYERYYPGPTRIVPVGSASLDILRHQCDPDRRARLRRRFRLNPERKVVMYIPIVMNDKVRSIPYNNRSPSRIFEIERALVSAFREFPDVQFVIKLLRSRIDPISPIADLVRDEKVTNCRVVMDPFQTVLPLADLFVLDYPSTIFLEALTTDKPILFCGHLLPWKWAPGVWHPSVLEMWQERVAYAEDLEEFLKLLRTYLREERFQPVKSKDTILKLFGTHLDDGKSAERAYDFLSSLAYRGEDKVPAQQSRVDLDKV